MTVFEVARELGRLITETEQAVLRDEAQEKFLQNDEAVKIMQKYEQHQREIEMKMQKGIISQEEFKTATTELKRLGTEVKAHPVAGAYVESINNFNKLLNQVFHIVQSTALGQLDNCCGEDGCECGHDGGCGCGGNETDGCACGCGHNH